MGLKERQAVVAYVDATGNTSGPEFVKLYQACDAADLALIALNQCEAQVIRYQAKVREVEGAIYEGTSDGIYLPRRGAPRRPYVPGEIPTVDQLPAARAELARLRAALADEEAQAAEARAGVANARGMAIQRPVPRPALPADEVARRARAAARRQQLRTVPGLIRRANRRRADRARNRMTEAERAAHAAALALIASALLPPRSRSRRAASDHGDRGYTEE